MPPVRRISRAIGLSPARKLRKSAVSGTVKLDREAFVASIKAGDFVHAFCHKRDWKHEPTLDYEEIQMLAKKHELTHDKHVVIFSGPETC